MSQENVELVRLVWEAAERRDNHTVFALCDPAIEALEAAGLSE